MKYGIKFLILFLGIALIAAIIIFLQSFVLQYFGKPPEMYTDLPLSTIRNKCIHRCNETRHEFRAGNEWEFLDAVGDYCTYDVISVKFDEQKMKHIDNIYILGKSADHIICADGAVRCFNVPGAECTINNTTLDSQNCLLYLCNALMKYDNYSKIAAERFLQNKMNVSCDLNSKTNPALKTQTWWEKYYEEPDCSHVYSLNSQNLTVR